MQNSDSCNSPAHRQLVHRVVTNQSGIVYPRQDGKCPNGSKYPPLIIEDETKHYVDGSMDGDDDSDDGEPDSKLGRSDLDGAQSRQKKTRGRVKIRMEFIQNKLRRYTTFSKRKTGIMKKVGSHSQPVPCLKCWGIAQP